MRISWLIATVAAATLLSGCAPQLSDAELCEAGWLELDKIDYFGEAKSVSRTIEGYAQFAARHGDRLPESEEAAMAMRDSLLESGNFREHQLVIYGELQEVCA